MSKRMLIFGAQSPTKLCQSIKFLDRFLTTEISDSLSPSSSPVSVLSAHGFEFLKDAIADPNVQSSETGKCSDDAFSIITCLRNYNDELGEKSQKFLRQFREKLDEDLVVAVLKNLQNTHLGVKFFLWAGRQVGYVYTLAVYNSLLDILDGNRSARTIDDFLLEIRDDDKEVLGKLLNILIRKRCNEGRWNLALEELGKLKDFGYKPSKVTYNALIRVFLDADKLDNCFILHREMSNSGFKMHLQVLGRFVYSLCKSGKWRDALNLIEKEDVVPDTVIYTEMIKGLCEASLFEEALECLNRMRSDSCIPNVITFQILLTGYLNKGKLGRCKRILSMMIGEGCYPTYKIFCSLVYAFCKSGDHSYAYKLFKKMEDCGIKPGYVVYNTFIGNICGTEDLPSLDALDLAEKAYGKMTDAGIVLNRINVINFARSLCRIGKYEKAYGVIREMMNNGFVPETGTYNQVIGFLCDGSKLDKALLLFKEMKSNGTVPNVHTYSILIDRFSKAGLIQQARIWFDEMIRAGCSPTIVTYTSVIHAYLKAGKISEVNELFDMMLSRGCLPNLVTFTVLIDGYSKSGDIEKACAIYERMRGNGDVLDVESYFENSVNGNHVPNVYTYGALIDGLCKAHRVEEAHKLLDTMACQACEPGRVVYDSLFDGFCKAGKLEKAQEVFAKMSDQGYIPDTHVYSSLMDMLFKDKRLDLSLKVLSKMLESSCSPDIVIYTVMIDGLCKVGKVDEAYKLMLMMEEKGCKPNVVTYTAMIDGFGSAGKVDRSLELFNEMTNKSRAPNFITYNVLIKHCCSAGFLDEALQLLEEMKQTYWPSYLVNYRKVVEGFSKEFIQSLEFMDEIGKNDSIPLIPAYKILINSLQKAGRMDICLDLHKELTSLPIPPSSHKVEKGFELYIDSIKKEQHPDLSVVVDYIKGLIYGDRWEDALLLSESLCYTDIRWSSKERVSEEK